MLNKELAKQLTRDGRDLCIACVILPCVAFALGVVAIHYPVPVLGFTIAACCLGWVAFYRLLAAPDVKELHGRIATVVSFATLSLANGFGSGMMAAGPGNYDAIAMALAFSFGLVGALIYRRHQREGSRAPLHLTHR